MFLNDYINNYLSHLNKGVLLIEQTMFMNIKIIIKLHHIKQGCHNQHIKKYVSVLNGKNITI